MSTCKEDIIFIDEYTVELGESVKIELYRINDVLQKYLQCLTKICEIGLIEGKTADALNAFISDANKKIAGENICTIGDSIAASSGYNEYVSKIDDADDPLY